MPEIALFADPQLENELEEVDLGEAELPWDTDITEGQPQHLFGKNDSGNTIRDFTIGLDGEGAETVRLAVDEDGSHGVWAEAGQSLFIAKYLSPNEEFSFWAQGLFSQEDRVGERPFEIVFSGVAIG